MCLPYGYDEEHEDDDALHCAPDEGGEGVGDDGGSALHIPRDPLHDALVAPPVKERLLLLKHTQH